MLNLNVDDFTAKCWCMSGATAMADSGASITNLKRAGGWKSTKVAKGYVAESAKMKSNQVAALADKQTAVANDANTTVEAENVAVMPEKAAGWAVNGMVVINNYFSPP
eukprot:8387233-Ditylum_brightwellii.AAC.1